MTVSPSDRIVIVGGGVFGISTAYHLLKRGFTDVTVLERASTVPAPDAASSDINKIVRSSYADSFYTRLAREAIAEWKKVEEWGDTYQECGCVMLSAGNVASYTDDAYHNDIASGARIETLENVTAMRALFPPDVRFAADAGPDTIRHLNGYINRDGGWAKATQGVAMMAEKVRGMGGKILHGKGVASLVKEASRTVGVKCQDGEVIPAALVVLAAGSWTASTFPELDLDTRCLATGQTVATIQLTEEEAARYRACPVILDFGSGFYMFPPNQQNIVKLAIHSTGFTRTVPTPVPDAPTGSQRNISTPRTITSHGNDGLRIPRSSVKALRSFLRQVYPELGKKPFSGTRLCWYTDSPDSDWVIGPHPSDAGILLATSGSGHAYKFLPVIGRLVADAVQGVMDPALVKRFAVDRDILKEDRTRLPSNERGFGGVQELTEDILCTPEDLLP
ncbi:FAD dependent oxidoreductase [Punctularia strigosozonata HHB-11173 SS5]|uniref:FAD dependent oxidoreductase n=1 Tax=Punctularia strigosozonata (strain HHB-11173) TaxID=741275 RepID=UPI0004416428|nr:FAD dependent oxidoreductase [Punctularia strigosozonata HHB-11173 SS5]EIN06698.1 FAD dependent oxidoreductase [Punctularia strigosozonata HHB-11173 SS5]